MLLGKEKVPLGGSDSGSGVISQGWGPSGAQDPFRSTLDWGLGPPLQDYSINDSHKGPTLGVAGTRDFAFI